MTRGLASVVAVGLALASTANAGSLVTNGSFEDPVLVGRAFFDAVTIPGWTMEIPGQGKLLTIDAPGTADDPKAPFTGAFPGYFTLYPGFPAVSPDGGNFVQGDGDPFYASALLQTITGLTPGSQYDVSFYQAAGQQGGSLGPTTERWQVSLGREDHLSSMYSIPEAGVGPWQSQTLRFTATSASEVLRFLAVGTPAGVPPISFLDGVSMNEVPEPATLTLFGTGVALLVGLRRRAKAA